MPEVTHYLWLDLETTGTDERRDDIIEVGFIITDKELVEKSYGSSVTQITETGWKRLKETPVVWEMHQENGLIADLERQNDVFPTAGAYSTFIVNQMKDMGIEPHRVMLAGSGVGHFDRRFVREQMHWLDGYLAYPVLDVGVLRRFHIVTGKQIGRAHV